MLSSKQKNKPLNIILLGDPAAGKETQARFLIKKFPLYDFDMGRELTRLRFENPEIDILLKKNYDHGKLTPTHVIRKILTNTIQLIPRAKGILFDGHPKMLGEAKLVNKLLGLEDRVKPIVIYLSIPLEETVIRMHDRKGYFSGKFGKRADDTDTALKNRVKYYRTNIAQVTEFFKTQYMFKKVSGLGTKEEVNKRLLATIRSMTTNG